MFIASLDLGTTGVRTFIFDVAGTILATDYQEWESYYPIPSYVEQDANSWWSSLKKTIEAAIKKSGIDKSEIVSLSVTNQRETIVPVDKEGNPLHNALVWQDRRTTDQVEFIRKKIGVDTIYRTTGLTIDPYFSATKILWFKDNKPEIYKNAHKFLLVSDYILFKLTGQFYTDFSNASRTMLFDINKLKYSDEIASELEIDLDKMPEALESGIDIGEITTDETLFDKKTLVITGAGDQQSAALGVGVTSPGTIKLTTGTGSFILAYLEKPNFDPKKRVLCSCHAVPGTWVQEASVFTTGAYLRWFRDEIAYEECLEAEEQNMDAYDIITKEASDSKVGANGLITIPHLVGAGAPHWNPFARGIIFGLALGQKRRDLARAILEGVAFEVKKNTAVLQELNIIPVELRLTGGGSRSDLWNQIIADVLGITCVRNVIEEATSLGAAILAASGAGIFPDIAEAAENICKVDRKWLPDKDRHAKYDKLYNFSYQLYNLLQDKKIYNKFNEILRNKENE
ncbi:MAG: carbohydrate kinase [Promethearchaeota archaeon]|nr:MAG: carbohydrate kinase [Candidatus Lokiarchaeota archaeon]